ncbi:hypothetical protein K1T35_43595 [Pseudonocardia sp. DSM 110487]|uniref:hypothetical protein n=1 Tax=Pseudonocardia sp. DSM 110487 TaxID=2865833 RepID=UPI001C6A866F|nr:hypothetical protein [Pseudonocardia sp. DSM 110487]QYN35148.1 hypothetical protein K1T35_43595 [Pseudonocardia sp. DSM 110487]
MFTDLSSLSAQSEHHRAELLADAENFRLARLVRQARRRRPETPRSHPPQPDPSSRNDSAERRYAVSR